MVYVAFDPTDEFWKTESQTIFQNVSFNHLSRRVGSMDCVTQTRIRRHTAVQVWETDLRGDDNVIFYSGHGGNPSGAPVSMPEANVFVDFLLANQVQVDRIVFVSCHTYRWLCRNYREFSRLLSVQHPTIRLEGSEASLVMRDISAIVVRHRNETYIHFECLRLTLGAGPVATIVAAPVARTVAPVPLVRQRANTRVVPQMIGLTGVGRNRGRNNAVANELELPITVEGCERRYVERVLPDFANNPMRVVAPHTLLLS